MLFKDVVINQSKEIKKTIFVLLEEVQSIGP